MSDLGDFSFRFLYFPLVPKGLLLLFFGHFPLVAKDDRCATAALGWLFWFVKKPADTGDILGTSWWDILGDLRIFLFLDYRSIL